MSFNLMAENMVDTNLTVIDPYGQTIPQYFEAKIKEAKMLRIPDDDYVKNSAYSIAKKMDASMSLMQAYYFKSIYDESNTTASFYADYNPIKQVKNIRNGYNMLQEMKNHARSYNPQKSVDIILELLKVKPNYYRGLYNLALAYSELRKHKLSIESFNKALAVKEKEDIVDNTIYNSAGWVNLRAHHYKAAIKLFRKSLKYVSTNKESSNAALHNNLGLVYFYTQKYEKAKKYLKIAADKYGSVSAKNTLKIILESEKEMKKRKKHYKFW